MASKVSSSLDRIILWYCANTPLFYLLIVKKAAGFTACQCLSLICLLVYPAIHLDLEGIRSIC